MPLAEAGLSAPGHGTWSCEYERGLHEQHSPTVLTLARIHSRFDFRAHIRPTIQGSIGPPHEDDGQLFGRPECPRQRHLPRRVPKQDDRLRPQREQGHPGRSPAHRCVYTAFPYARATMAPADTLLPPFPPRSGRVGTPEDIGGLAVFLSSRAASHITGTATVVDGGNSLQFIPRL